MAVRFCHPILIWMFNLLLIISTTFLALIFIFTTFSSRPRYMTREMRLSMGLTTSEKCAVAHIAFTLCAGVFIHAAMKLVSNGSHRDYFFRIEKDFKILCILVCVSTLLVAVLGIVIYVLKDSALTFNNGPPVAGATTTMNAIEWYFGTTSKPPVEVVRTETNVQIYVLFLLIADLLSLLLSILGAVTIVGCNQREKYDVEKAMMYRANSRSSIPRSREYLPRKYSMASS